MLVMIALFVGFTFSSMSVDVSTVLEAPANTVIQAEMAAIIFVILVVVVMERYANRSDTKPIVNTGLEESKENKNYFSHGELGIQRTTTARSMTVKLKTMKTTDLDI